MMPPRAYWTTQMNHAFDFMESMRRYPLEESREPLASLRDAADGLDVVFSTSLINHESPRVYFIREGLVPSFQALAREANARGWQIKVEDGYRSPEMQRAQSHNPRHFDLILQKTIWELEGAIPTPELMFRRLSAIIATRCRIGTHVSGSAIDISIFNRDTGQEVERGGRYIEISERTPMASPFITPQERENRDAIEALFRRHGWMPYPYEFWHFSQGDSYAETVAGTLRPSRYGPVRFDGATATPIPEAEADALLEPLSFYEAQIADALGRLGRA